MKYVSSGLRKRIYKILHERENIKGNPIKKLNVVIYDPLSSTREKAKDVCFDKNEKGLLITLTSSN